MVWGRLREGPSNELQLSGRRRSNKSRLSCGSISGASEMILRGRIIVSPPQLRKAKKGPKL